jgi:gluconate kinase
LLYDDDVQVLEEQDEGEGAHMHHDEGEGANLHHEEEHHNHEAGELNENQRWAWIHNEVERMSTEQQRQGVEISGLRNEVQRGNRINEENNEILR